MENQELEQAIRDLYFSQRGGDSFRCQLYRLFGKADPNNRTRLALAFPVESQAYAMWYRAPDEQAFFRDWIPNYDGR